MRTALVGCLIASSLVIAVAEQLAQKGPARPPVRVGQGVPMPRKIRDVRPIYSKLAQAAGAQGIVVMEILVGADGKVANAKVLKGSPLLDQAAIDAVRQWEFEPTRIDGVAVPVIVTTTVTFALDATKAAPAVPAAPNSSPAAVALPRETASPAQGRASLSQALGNLENNARQQELREATDDATIQIDGGDVDFNAWAPRFVAQVRGNWAVPIQAGEIGRNVVRFTVQRNGQITDAKVMNSSKVAAYNLCLPPGNRTLRARPRRCQATTNARPSPST